MTAPRLVAVFGYSRGGASELHPVCRERLAVGAAQAQPEDVVLLSGRGRRRAATPEAVLMAAAWRGATSRLLLDRDSRTTHGNALAAGAAARRLDVREIVLVTSGWHARRAAVLLRATLAGSDIAVTLAATSERGGLAARARELVCWPLVPLLAAAARKR